ncbi:putative Mn2+ efflux pump MntP [Tumebacillus sp. BK434]|nr:putative Mn2+ efflux pump MntP [Tumebacillus sp. BK434]
MMTSIQWGEFMTLLLMALALGMDAFSLGLGMGMLRLNSREISKISLTIGLFHVLMPLIGMAAGLYLAQAVGEMTKWIGALLLIGLGVHMVWNSLKGDDEDAGLRGGSRTTGLGLILFALSVSIDSLSVGFSLGTLGANVGVAVALFGICGAMMAATGLSIGSRASHLFGEYGEAIGGAVLVAFGVKFLL